MDASDALKRTWISPAAAAERTGLSPQFIRKLVRRGDLKGRKVGRRIVVDEVALHEFMADVADGRDR